MIFTTVTCVDALLPFLPTYRVGDIVEGCITASESEDEISSLRRPYIEYISSPCICEGKVLVKEEDDYHILAVIKTMPKIALITSKEWGQLPSKDVGDYIRFTSDLRFLHFENYFADFRESLNAITTSFRIIGITKTVFDYDSCDVRDLPSIVQRPCKELDANSIDNEDPNTAFQLALQPA